MCSGSFDGIVLRVKNETPERLNPVESDSRPHHGMPQHLSFDRKAKKWVWQIPETREGWQHGREISVQKDIYILFRNTVGNQGATRGLKGYVFIGGQRNPGAQTDPRWSFFFIGLARDLV